MKYQKVIIFNFAIIVIGAALYFGIFNRSNLLNQTTNDATRISEQTTLQTQTLTDGTVTYTVTPKGFIPSATTWDFTMSLDTHTGSLDQDMVALISFIDNKGNAYQPTKWEGDPPGGHHREGILQFLPVFPRPSFVELNIQTTDSAKESRLRWNL